MAKPLVFQFGDRDLPFDMTKVDRSKLYGYKATEAIDGSGSKCELATLTDDGQTIVASGGTGLGYVSPDGLWCDKSSLKPIDAEGNEIKPVPSSFAAPVKLFETATVDDYFQYNIKSVYQLQCELPVDDLLQELRKGTLFTFPYSYRGGLEADTGFLLCNEEGTVFLAVGTPTKAQFIGLQQQAALLEDEEDSEEADLMDFDMI